MDTTGTLFMPPGASTLSSEVDSLFYFIFYASVILFLIVTGATAWFVLKYRRRRNETTSGIAHNTKLEIAWTAIPTVLILIVFFWGFKTFLKMNVVPKDALEIKVTAQKWFWSFDYPDGATSVNELVVPVDRPISLVMSSQDVIHSFFVPDFRMKMDVLPNRYTISWFEAPDEGEHNLFCTEFCGTGHSEMIGKVKVVSAREYAAWIENASAAAEGESLEDYGAKLYVSKACVTCHKLDGSASTGPSFKNIFGHKALMSDGSEVDVDENYLRESILNPTAKVVGGYQPVMPTYQGVLKDREIDALIAFIKSLKDKEGSDHE